MQVQIGEEYRITGTRHSWVIERHCLGQKKPWRRISHHGSLLATLNALADQHIRNSQIGSLQQAMAEVVKISEQIADAFAPVISLDLSKLIAIHGRHDHE